MLNYFTTGFTTGFPTWFDVLDMWDDGDGTITITRDGTPWATLAAPQSLGYKDVAWAATALDTQWEWLRGTLDR